MTELLLSSREVRNFLNYRFPGRGIGRGGPHHWPARSTDLSPLDYCVWGWMKELVLQCEGGNARCIAWSHFGCRRPHQKQRKLQRATRAVHNRAAACVAAGGGIFENVL